jgi:hypothetical protein
MAARQTELERVLVLDVVGPRSDTSPSLFTRDELTAAFVTFEQTVDRAAKTQDWDAWAGHYTEDVTYVDLENDDRLSG